MNSHSNNNEVWGIIPARGGSKSIPLKNMALLAGRPLIDYVICAARQSSTVSRFLCSTDHDAIADFCGSKKVEICRRPERLCADAVAVADVVVDLLTTLMAREGRLAEIIVLLEPTYPFLLARHIDECGSLLRENPRADSVQSLTPVSHNSHAYNQRSIRNGNVDFVFKEERIRCYNKQLKPQFYVHGNLFVSRARTILETKNIYGACSLPYTVEALHAFDVDGPQDLIVANALVAAGCIE